MYGGMKYSSVYVDYVTKFTSYFETIKIDSATSCKIARWFLAWCERHLAVDVLALRSDRGSDYASRAFGEVLLER